MMGQKLMKIKISERTRMNLTKYLHTVVLENRFIKFNEFLRLRADSHAQYEIRCTVMLESLKKWVPITYEAFMDYRVDTEVSANGKNNPKLIKGENISYEESKLSKREWNELMEAFDLKIN